VSPPTWWLLHIARGRRAHQPRASDPALAA